MAAVVAMAVAVAAVAVATTAVAMVVVVMYVCLAQVRNPVPRDNGAALSINSFAGLPLGFTCTSA